MRVLYLKPENGNRNKNDKKRLEKKRKKMKSQTQIENPSPLVKRRQGDNIWRKIAVATSSVVMRNENNVMNL